MNNSDMQELHLVQKVSKAKTTTIRDNCGIRFPKNSPLVTMLAVSARKYR